MRKIVILLVLFLSMMLNAQEKQKIRLAEIEIFPEFLKEYLEKAKTIGTISMQEEEGVICIFPMQVKENPTKIRVVEIYSSEKSYEYHIKTKHFLEYKNSTLHMVKSLKLIEMDAMDERGMDKIFRKLE